MILDGWSGHTCPGNRFPLQTGLWTIQPKEISCSYHDGSEMSTDGRVCLIFDSSQLPFPLCSGHLSFLYVCYRDFGTSHYQFFFSLSSLKNFQTGTSPTKVTPTLLKTDMFRSTDSLTVSSLEWTLQNSSILWKSQIPHWTTVWGDLFFNLFVLVRTTVQSCGANETRDLILRLLIEPAV